MPEKCRKNRFLAFSRDFIISFFWFFAQRCVSNAQNMAESDFEKIFFSGWKYWKYAGNRRFCRFSSDLFLIFRCFFSHKTLLISMLTINYVSIVNKTYFWSRNFLKLTGNRRFCRFSFDFFLIFLVFLKSLYVSYFTSFSISILYLSLGRFNMQCACCL